MGTQSTQRIDLRVEVCQQADFESILCSKEVFLKDGLRRVVRSLAFENVHTADPIRLSELPSEEFSRLRCFVRDNDADSVFNFGKMRAEEGIDIKTVLGMGSWWTNFILESAEIARQNLTNVAIATLSDYMASYIEGYTVGKMNKTMRQQKEIRTALSAALLGQKNELFIKNHSLSSSINAILLTDFAGRVTYVNASFWKMWGYADIDEVLSVGCIDRLIGIEADKIFQSLQSAKTWRGELRLTRPDNSEFEVEMAASLIIDDYGNQFGIMASFVDITERNRMAFQLKRSQKMESLGQLAAGITHDFNNMFAVVKGYIHLILRDVEKDSQLSDDIKQIKVAIERSAGLTQQLQCFARTVDVIKRPIDINEVIQESCELLRHAFPPGIDFSINLAGGLWMVEADTSQLSHSIVNLCVNAKDAIVQGWECSNVQGSQFIQSGTIVIETENRVFDESSFRIHLNAAPGRYVCISVRDNGVGMNKKTLERLFEPFFTTKKTKKNSGLGLSIIYGIVDKLNGFIDVYSKVGEGSAFYLYLPASQSFNADKEEEEASTLHIPNEHTVLVVDDELQILQIVSRELTADGYNVLTARNGKEAVSVFEKERPNIEIIILDMIMPQMDGENCLKAIRKIDPDVDVILTTGFTVDEFTMDKINDLGNDVIEKPFDLSKLSSLLKNKLGKRRQARTD